MTLSETIANANTAATPHKAISQADNIAATGKLFWRALATGFWAYTEEASKTETKSYEGLL